MLLAAAMIEAAFQGMKAAHVTDWNTWVTWLPMLIGVPAWGLWTRAKLWAVQNMKE